jgi:hypothetical protein
MPPPLLISQRSEGHVCKALGEELGPGPHGQRSGSPWVEGGKGGEGGREGEGRWVGSAGAGWSLKVGESKRRQNTRERRRKEREKERPRPRATETESDRDRDRGRDSVCEIHEIERGGGTRISPGRESWPGSPSSPRAAGPFPAEFAGWVYSHMLMRQKPVRGPACVAPGPAGQAAVTVAPGARPALRGPSRWSRGGHAPRPAGGPAGAARLVSAVQRHRDS